MMQTNETNFPEMLTIDQTAKRSGLSAYAVRKLARSSTGQAFTVRVGTKYLINWERFTAFFNCGAVGENPSAECNPSVTCGDSSAQGTSFGRPFRGAYAKEQPSAGIQPVPVRL
ncbi:hypothetical protein [uncultured Ruminococcus sp.]|uniref:hypothetical protein n=1 Tax=uncultured Ruminococcus sp. TaxID=165186 RepID=UPI0025D5C4A5|nr:hypothetical protein [uncultured Ruminococcus sp.]